MNYFPIFKILIFSILSNVLFAQAASKSPSKIFLKTGWQKGESYSYELKKGKKNFIDTVEVAHTETRQLITLSVIETSTKGYTLEAAYQSAAYFLPEEVKKLPGIAQMVEKYRHFKVKYAVSPFGEFLGILNGKDIQQMLVELFDKIEASRAISEAESTVLTNLKCQMTSEVHITEGLFQELRLLHQFYNNVFLNNIQQNYETQLANMLIPQGAPIAAQATLKAYVKESEFTVIEQTLTPDALTMKKLMFDYLNKMSNGVWQVKNTTDEIEENLDLIIKDKGIFVYHIATGWLNELLKTRTITLNGEKTIEYTSMKLLEQGSF